ncbi:MAG: flagellar filament capping protein FliD [Sulfurimonas sp.]|jgi:flagellar hook-associated protein 2
MKFADIILNINDDQRLLRKGFIMGVSSLGVGSSILTQSVLDQLRAADDAKFITPVTLDLANEGDKKGALDTVKASMKNLIDSITEIKSQTLYSDRKAALTGTSVAVTAASNSDLQDFSLEVVNLATKQIEQSGSFASNTSTIATGAGNMNLNIDGTDYTIAYDATTTLDGFKKLINDAAGDKVDATVVQINGGDFRLFISSVGTGTTQNITMTDTTGNLTPAASTALTTAFDGVPIQTGVAANLKFNGQAITRQSNTVDDLITGLNITLKEVGTTNVSVQQDRDTILTKMDSFVSKYNDTITELGKMTKQSTDSATRGIFSNESTIKSMQRTVSDMFASISGTSGTMNDYGFDVDKDGKLSLNKTTFGAKMDANAANVEAFFAGGTFTQTDGTKVAVTGAFDAFATQIEGYTTFNATLDQLQASIADKVSALEDRKAQATQRLDDRYAIMKKQYAAYDLIISKINSASSMFKQMTTSNTSNN